MSLNRFRTRPIGKIDGWLLLGVLTLVGFGLVMISSSSVVLSQQYFGTNYAFVSKQLEHVGVGLVLMAILSRIDYRFWQRVAPGVLGLMIVLLLATLIPGIGQEVNGAQRWITLGSFTFQPTELVKLLAILYFSAWLAARQEHIQSLVRGLLPFLTLLGLIAILILIQPDAGTAMVTVATVICIYFVAGAPWTHLGYGLLAGGGALGTIIASAPYRLERLLTFLNPSANTLGSGYHINQALLAIGAGNWFGLGFGASKQKFLYLPEPHTDSIFAITIEELGFVRALLVLGVLLGVIVRGYQIVRRSNDPFARYVATGITSLIAIQSFTNIGAMLGLSPLTGVTLPFISYGGTSLIILMGAVGILLNISRSAERPLAAEAV